MAATMRAARIDAPGKITMARVDVPEPSAGEVRVRMEGSGVCGSDLAIWEGRPWFEYPREAGSPGHEGWGVVDAVGDGVTDLQVGDRVTGFFQKAFAEYEVLPAAHLVIVPAALGERPYPGEPFACAINAFHRCEIEEGQTVAVVGAGFIGAMLVDLCARAGAEVIAVSRRPYALKVAESVGAKHLLGLEDGPDPVQEVERLTGGRLCDRVIEATGKQAPLDLATKLTRTRGRLIIAGFHQDGTRTVDMQTWNWRGLDVINAHEREVPIYMQGIRESIDAVLAERFDPFPLLTHTFQLDDLPKAFEAMSRRPDGFLKAVIRV